MDANLQQSEAHAQAQALVYQFTESQLVEFTGEVMWSVLLPMAILAAFMALLGYYFGMRHRSELAE